MEFVPARAEHLAEILGITTEARAQLKRLGVDQWQRGYPNGETWTADIESGSAWVLLDNGKVAGAFAFVTGTEASYAEIDGKWLSAAPYASLHRVCVADAWKGCGLAGLMMAHGVLLARGLGLASLRIDTHRDNLPMRRAIEKAGFSYCGVIHLPGGEEAGNERVAFEMLL